MAARPARRANPAPRVPHADAAPLELEDPVRACAHLRAADATLAALIERIGVLDGGGPLAPATAAELYGGLVRAIAGQQLSTTAARAIHARLCAFFGGGTPEPAAVLAADPEAMRAAAGLSRAKVASLRSLAEHVLDGALELERMSTLGDERVIAELTAVRGIGPWTAHMFLMFRLRRPDVLPVGDQGIRVAAGRLYGLAGPAAPDELTRLAAPWRPHRTTACRYLWASLDAAPGA